MNVHRFEKLWIAGSILLIVGLIATVTYGAVGAGVQMVDDEGGTVDSQNLPAEFQNPGVRQVGDEHYAVYIVAQQFLFQPGSTETIQLPADRTVTFYVTSKDVVHGFQVVGTNVNAMVLPGQVTELTVRFDEPGHYGIVCNEYCGAGHHDMAGEIEVVPASEYEG